MRSDVSDNINAITIHFIHTVIPPIIQHCQSYINSYPAVCTIPQNQIVTELVLLSFY